MRAFWSICLVLTLVALIPSGKAEAAFRGSNGEEQCYALQYEASELKMVKGDIAQGYAAVFSTAEVCANTDASGKVVGKLYDGASQPSGTTELKKAKLTRGDTAIFLYTSSKANAEPKSFFVDKYDTFKDLVKAVNDVAPSEYTVTNIFSTAAFGSKMKKTAFDADYKTTSEVREEVTEAAAAINSGDANTVAAMCQEAGLKGLSWVACPVMDGTAQTISALDAMIGSWLAVDTAFYSGESATYEVWSVMRDIANIALVVVLLIIIFSQLTGVGIDNYGIKKMLPRLIAMAILINLSFIACQLVIDISNILGVSLNTLFRSVGARVMPDDAAVGNFLATAITTMFAMVGVTGSIGGTALAVVGVASTIGAPVMVVIILLALIPVIAAVLLFFVMLGARMALVIALTAVAPIVAVLYVLPNTQKWAKKWWNLFFAILVMYPLCGAIAGISYLIKAMVLSMEGPHLWMMIIGVIGPFLPFFLLPTLLKNAISMLGAAGDALVAMGRGWQSGIRRGSESIQNSERFKEEMQFAKDTAQAERAQRLLNRIGSGQNLTRRQQYRRLNAQKIVNARTMSDAEARVGAYGLDPNVAESRALSTREAQEYRAYMDQFAGFSRDQLEKESNNAGVWLHEAGGEQRMSALLATMESKGMEQSVYRTLANHDVGNMSSVMQMLAGSNNRVLKAYGKTGSGVSYQDFMQGGMYRDVNGQITNQAVDAQGNANTAVSMARYAEQKGGEFVNGLDDKALTQIRAYSNAGNEIMSTGQLTQAAANLNDEASMQEINAMLAGRNDLDGVISGEQLTKFNTSTLNELATRAGTDINVKNAILRASNAVVADPKLVASMNDSSKTVINNVRATRNLSPIP